MRLHCVHSFICDSRWWSGSLDNGVPHLPREGIAIGEFNILRYFFVSFSLVPIHRVVKKIFPGCVIMTYKWVRIPQRCFFIFFIDRSLPWSESQRMVLNQASQNLIEVSFLTLYFLCIHRIYRTKMWQNSVRDEYCRIFLVFLYVAAIKPENNSSRLGHGTVIFSIRFTVLHLGPCKIVDFKHFVYINPELVCYFS